MTGSGLTGGTTEVSGRVAGAVLAAIRTQCDRTQDQLAQELGVGLSTVQAWESGRRPLINARFVDLTRLRRHLQASDATVTMLDLLERALAVDTMYAEMHEGPDRHPLGLTVPDRVTTELLIWPLTGDVPHALRGSPARLDVPHGLQDAVAADLRCAADLAGDQPRAAMMRRQVKYLVADNPASADWLHTQVGAETRSAPDLRTWSHLWPVARSHAIAAAIDGDTEPLLRFIDHGLADDRGVVANLNYWAYWVGEYDTDWTSDADMTSSCSNWSGYRLLDSLLNGVVTAPYRDLCAHALWALLRHRRHLARTTGTRQKIRTATDRALSESRLNGHARHRLEQVDYLAESED